MSLPRVFVTRIMPPPGLDVIRAACETIVWEEELPPPYEILRDHAARVDGLLCMVTDRIDADLLAAAPQLKVISQMAVGVDNIDVQAATARKLPVGHTPGVLTETTADFAFALLISAARRLPEGERYVRGGHWRTWAPTLLLGRDVYGATLGIIGMGRIGQAVAKRASGFEMRVIYSGSREVPEAKARGYTWVSQDELLAQSDFISLHTPLTPQTHHLIDAAAFAKMKPTCILINTARGAVVDPDALYTALTTGQIAATALDVTEPEPIPVDHRLLTLDNCLIVPHLGSASVATRRRMAQMAAENLIAGVRGERLPYCVNPIVYADPV